MIEITSTKLKKLVPAEGSPRPRRTPRRPPICDEAVAFGIGVDVHKDSLATCVSAQVPSGEIVEVQDHVFRNTVQGVQEFCRFVGHYMEKATVLMECTGVYHVHLFQTLQAQFPIYSQQILAMNPLLVHNRISELGTKTDRADARTLASLAFYKKILRPSYVGTPTFIATRDLMRSYHRNHRLISVFRNRIHRQLHLANQKFHFDLSTEWALHLLDRYISQDWSLGECFEVLVAELQERKAAKVLEKQAAEILPHAEVRLTREQRFLLQVDLIRLLSAQEAGTMFLVEAEGMILKESTLCDHYERLLLVPGFSSVTVLTILTEVGDYTRFRSIDAFSKFCGVIPTVEQSGAVRSRGHVNRYTNSNIRKILTQAASVIISRPNRQTDMGQYAYHQFRERLLPFKKATLKVGWKYSRIIWSILTEGRSYDPAHELQRKKAERIRKRIATQGTSLDTARTRVLRRKISTFLVANSELLNRHTRFHLVQGFQGLIRKARYLDKTDPTEKTKN